MPASARLGGGGPGGFIGASPPNSRAHRRPLELVAAASPPTRKKRPTEPKIYTSPKCAYGSFADGDSRIQTPDRSDAVSIVTPNTHFAQKKPSSTQASRNMDKP